MQAQTQSLKFQSAFRQHVELRWLIVPILMLLIAGLAFFTAAPLQAAEADTLSLRVDCNGFISRGGSLLLNRDNTGSGREQFIITATDGEGNVIYAPTVESLRVGLSIQFPDGLYWAWTTAPSANPLTVRIISQAGNGLNEQVVYSILGNCAELESTTAEPAVNTLPQGSTSPSIPLNVTAPRPKNPEGSVRGSEGYLIVNTDNLNVRSGDGAEYTVVAKVDGGTELIVLGRNASRTWWYVQIGDILGWVNGELTLIRGDLTRIPIVPVTGEIAAPTLFLYSTTSLRTGPEVDSAAICDIRGNQEYYVIGRTASSGWYELQANCGGTVTGWVRETSGGLRNPAGSFIPVTQ